MFLPRSVRLLVNKLEQDGLVDTPSVVNATTDVYKMCSVFRPVVGHFQELVGILEWASLKRFPKWSDVERRLWFLLLIFFFYKFDTELFEEFSFITQYISDERVSECKVSDTN